RHEVTYWHVELDRHEVLLAEGLQVESYLDTGNRNAFANAEGFVELHPDFMPKHTTVRLKTWEIQLVIVLCNFETVGLARECRLDLDLFKNRHRKDLQQCVERRLQPEPFAHDRNQHIDRNGDPDLRLHGVLRRAIEPFDPQVLFDPFEKKLHLPAAFV